jgi:hypothetical protein
MAIRVQARPMLSVLGLALLSLAGCDKIKLGLGQGGDMAYAQAAIERNGQLEVVAVDANNSVFTVRVKDTGELKTVRADEVIGTLPGDAAAKAAVAPAAPTPAPIAAPPTQTVENVPASDVAQPGEAATSPSQDDSPPAPYTANAQPFVPSEPSGRGVLATGPGYTIKRSAGSSQTTPSAIRTSTTADASPNTSGASLEHRYEPIICQGGRLLHIDGRNIEFAGDAVSAEDGCEIHITNSRIKAQGVGVFARNANVHIKNSTIEGTTGSVEATNGAQVYVQSSTFKGLSRRLDTATLHDLGGNVWN